MENQRRPPLHQRRFWILPDFQGRMVAHWALLSFTTGAMTSLIVLAAAFAYLGHRASGEYMFVEIPREALNALDNVHFVKLSKIVLVCGVISSILGCLVAVVAGVFYSHRIAGPLFRMRRVIADSLDGKAVDPIILRENDELKELADDLNQLLKRR